MTRPLFEAGPSAKAKSSFVDRARISMRAGHGGDGCRSLYQDLWTRHPRPDGGNGGRGGSVLIRANPQQTTLLDFQTRRHFKAGSGNNGSSKGKNGAQGTDLVIEVPLGTILWDDDTEEQIRDLVEPGEEVMIARGGAGGLGNASQKRTGLSPRSKPGPGFGGFDPARLHGHAGEERKIRLELKVLADVGIVGMPNAGKSTLIRRISEARPKVAAFPFTTLHPVLGAVRLPSGAAIVAVDVPGLIEGAHLGKGLGLDFLRHIERTRLLLHLVDMAGQDGRDPVEDYRALLSELEAYRKELAEKPRIVVANKMDRPEAKANLMRFRKETKVRPVVSISAETGEGVPELLEKVSTELKKLKGKA
ncbi:MAG: GTPase ObgE [Candidatus Omnitrophica bacterium]|nr:GTPase ObgE [Candidatus Omnitrophota bacterium]